MLVSLACPGMFKEWELRYEVSQARGWGYVHAWLDYHRRELRWAREEWNEDVVWEGEVRERWVPRGARG
jgi:hypothetical protein